MRSPKVYHRPLLEKALDLIHTQFQSHHYPMPPYFSQLVSYAKDHAIYKRLTLHLKI